MAIVWIGIFVGFIWMPNDVKASTNCKMSNIQSRIDDQACEPLEYTNISTSERGHCSLACAHIEECRATIFDRRHSICMIMPQPCVLLKPRSDHVYQSFAYPCTKWVPASDKVEAFWIYENYGITKAYVARAFVNNDLLLGKLTDNFHSINPGGSYTRGGISQEKMVVDSSCSVAWFSYDATSGQPMPADAMIGGLLTATNTPLYVSRQQKSGCDWALGYYNPINRKAWGECYGVQGSSTFEVMVAQPRHVITYD